MKNITGQIQLLDRDGIIVRSALYKDKSDRRSKIKKWLTLYRSRKMFIQIIPDIYEN